MSSPQSLLKRAPPRILIVEDNATAAALTGEMLRLNGYAIDIVADAAAALEAVNSNPPDLILLDVLMPGRDGIDLCRELKEMPATRLIPVILITGMADRDLRLRAIEAGADDFLNKPFDPEELFARVGSLVKIKLYTDEMENIETVLFSIALGVEARDPYTEGHCARLAEFASDLGIRLGLSVEDVVALRRGGMLHDIGKLIVPDSILRKPSLLTSEEVRVVRQHPILGEQICLPMRSLSRVLPIIRSHHEHWNGRGYPDGLEGEQIPLLARILQVADAYDALTTARPYKPAWSHAEAKARLLAEASEGWWDESILQQFLYMQDERLGAERRSH